jgi:hypothetical protein
MGNGRAMERRPSPWLADLADTCETSRTGRPTHDVARRFADLRANLKH